MTRPYTKRTLEEQYQDLERKKLYQYDKLDRIGAKIGKISDKQQTLKTRMEKRKATEVKP